MKKVLLTLLLLLSLAVSAYGATTVTNVFTVTDDPENNDEDHPREFDTLYEVLSYLEDGEAPDEDSDSVQFTEAVIRLEKDITLGDEDFDDARIIFDSSYYSNLTSLTITGSSNTSLRKLTGSGATRHIFLNNSRLTLTLRNLELDVDSGADSNGGGILVQAGTLNVDNVKFTELDTNGLEELTDDDGNTVSDYSGGAVHVSGRNATVTIASSTFTECVGTNGGAVCVETGSAAFSGENVFTGCSATLGGAVYNTGTATFSGSATFTSNSATTDGGAVYNTGSMTFSSSAAFSSSTSSGNGGAIYNTGTMAFSDNATFSSSSATTDGGAVYNTGTVTFSSSVVFGSSTSSGSGGALYNTGTATFAGSATFEDSSATTDGGAVYNTGTATFSNSATFTSNSAGNDGGAVHNTGALSFTSSGLFTGNKATGDGGAINTTGGDVTLSSLTFGNGRALGQNTAVNGGAVNITGGTVNIDVTGFNMNSADCGGALSITGGTVSISGSSFTTNKATNGGGIYASSTVTLGTDSNTFTDNTATSDGGAIYLYDDSSAVLNVTGSLTLGEGNSAVNGGGMYVSQRASVNATSIAAFRENKAVNGGGLWLYSGAQLAGFKSGASFSDNEADYGGAIYVAIEGSSTLRLSNEAAFTFSNNSANYDGGAIYTVQSNVAIIGQDIENANSAPNGGGGFVYSGGIVTVTDSTISRQTASYGGAIFASGAVTVDNSMFSNNTTTTESGASLGGGGAIYASGDVTITSSDFVSNTHTNNSGRVNGGGAVFVNDSSLTITESRFSTNQALGTSSRGGAIYVNAVYNRSAVAVTDSYFYNNEAVSNAGAAIFYGQCATTIQRTTFESNTSRAIGGAVYAQGSLTLDRSYLYGNRSSGNGGAIYFDQRNNEAQPGTFISTSTMYTDNSAGIAPTNGQGGALYLNADVVTINRNTFNGNQSTTSNGDSRGGAIFANTSGSASSIASSIRNSVFYENKALDGSTNYGGAIYTQGDISISMSSFTKNTATTRGGGLYVGSGRVTILGTILVGNDGANGRDVYAEGDITSRGYNRIGVYGKGNADTSWIADIEVSTYDRENSTWTSATFFGTAELAYSDATLPVGNTLIAYLGALVLHEAQDLAIDDRATNAIPYDRRYTLNIDQYDIWGIDRFASGNAISIGAHHSSGSGGNQEPGEEGLYNIESITMSGIPNTLKNIGQTASLVAVVHYTNGRVAYGVPYDTENVTENAEERIHWSSSMPNYVAIDKHGNITALRATSNSTGAKITVQTVRTTSPDGTPAEASHYVMVTEDSSYMNISPAYQSYIADYVSTLEHDISVAVADVDIATVNSAVFRQNFTASWNAAPNQITELTTSTPMLNTYTSYNQDGMTASKNAAVNINYQNRSTGDILPMVYSWVFTGDELQEVLGHDLKGRSINASLAEEIFSRLRISYQAANGTRAVVGGSGVSGAAAMNSGALALTQADGGAGVHIDLTAYLANVKTSGTNDGPQVVNGNGTRKALVVPDGADDGAITGAMWMLQPSSSTTPTQPDDNNNNSDNNNNVAPNPGNNGGGGGGGGGCASMSLGLLGLVLLLKRR